MVITKHDVEIALHPERHRSQQEQSDMLCFQGLMDSYGPDTVLTWWKNCTQIMFGETLPSPGRITDPRR